MSGEFPNIQSTHSLVAKHVTKDKWDQLKAIETKTCGGVTRLRKSKQEIYSAWHPARLDTFLSSSPIGDEKRCCALIR